MPKCLSCGNVEEFGVMDIPSTAPTANGPISGLLGHFNPDGDLETMESIGATLDQAQEAYERPGKFFDVCLTCGSTDIEW